MTELHDRMPVILEPSDWPTWSVKVDNAPDVLLRPAANDVRKVWPVGRAGEFGEEQWSGIAQPVE
jgi:putative SOS response-associated peptidase YedK